MKQAQLLSYGVTHLFSYETTQLLSYGVTQLFIYETSTAVEH
jgi:hypothetical protein